MLSRCVKHLPVHTHNTRYSSASIRTILHFTNMTTAVVAIVAVQYLD